MPWYLILLSILSFTSYARVDRIHSEVYLGEKKLDSYSGRYVPLIFQDMYQGKMTFADDLNQQNFFQPYIFQKENDFSFFFRSELNGGLSCSNELLGEHFDDIHFSYRLITLSYLLEAQWHMKMVSDHLRLKNGCDFDLKKWLNSCSPKSPEMKNFVERMTKFLPKYEESLPSSYKKEDWYKELSQNNPKWFSHYRIKSQCKGKCEEGNLPSDFKNSCEADQELMTLICSETDQIYGLSTNRDAYYLIGQSNIINTYNKKGEAEGCLRRFSEVMSHKEVRYDNLKNLFPVIQTFLRGKYQERFLQGRVFFFGAGKEFEAKGLKDLYVKEQPIQIEKIIEEKKLEVTKEVKPVLEKAKVEVVAKVEEAPKKELKEIRKPLKSAFIIAAEIRNSQNLDRVEVDMMKLRYDYVFSLNMINMLTERLKSFMTREALKEMVSYDKLGSKEAPVPLLFIKFMIDMQEHQGMWNLLSVLGDKFYVSNEIDASFKPDPELVQLVNNDATGRQWQIFILKP